MKKFNYIIRAIFEGEICDKDVIISEIESCKILKELLPFLVHHKIVGHFYALIVSNNLISHLDKESWRLITKIIIYEQIKNKKYYLEMQNICCQLEKENIKYAILKGAHLNFFLYNQADNLIRRTFNDIDILVKKNDVKHINDMLKNLGYIKGEYSPEINDMRQYTRQEEIQFFMTTHQSPQFIKLSKIGDETIKDVFIIDVNFTIFDGGKKVDPISTTDLLEQTIARRDMNGNIYYSLKIEHDFIQIVYHIYKDTIYDIKKDEKLLLSSLVDMYRYIKIYGKIMDWKYVYKIVENAQIVTEVSMLLRYIKQWTSNRYVEEFLCWTQSNKPTTTQNESCNNKINS